MWGHGNSPFDVPIVTTVITSIFDFVQVMSTDAKSGSVIGESDTSVLLNWIFGAVAVVTATLAAVVRNLYAKDLEQVAKDRKEMVDRIEKLETRCDECEKDRVVLSVRCARLETEVEILRKETTE